MNKTVENIGNKAHHMEVKISELKDRNLEIEVEDKREIRFK